MKQAILRLDGPIAAHLVAVGPTALSFVLLRMPSTREERGLLGRHATGSDARHTVELADSGLGARIPGEPLIACLI